MLNPPHPYGRRAAACGRARLAALLLLVLGAVCPQAQRRSDLPREANAKPSATIPLQPSGFVPPPANQLLQHVAGTTLNFVDNDHLLFTFHKQVLLKRAADAQPDDDDQMIRAQILNIASGQIEAESDWRMHDRSRYLWSVGKGRFLVRRRNRIFETDASLRLEPYAEFSGKLRSLQPSIDGKILVVETEEDERQSASRPSTRSAPLDVGSGDVEARERALPIKVRILDLQTRKVLGHTESRVVPVIPTIEPGFLDEIRAHGDRWLVNFRRFDGGDDRKIAEIASSCLPMLDFLSTSAALISTCERPGGQRLLTAANLDGRILWDRRMDGRRIWPAFAFSEDGSRFALGTLVVNHGISGSEPFGQEDVLGQLVEVFDSVGGESRLLAPATPALDMGQNFALSPDGHRFAVLHNGAIEVYELK